MINSKEVWDVLVVGDTYHPVPKFVTEWLLSEPDVSEHVLPYMETPPDEILEFCELSEDDEDSEIDITELNWENDRALWLTGFTYCLESIREVKKFMKDNNYEFGEEKHYYDY